MNKGNRKVEEKKEISISYRLEVYREKVEKDKYDP